MAKEMIYFNATKQIETITIHYNSRLDGSFVDDVVKNIKEVSQKFRKIDLKKPKEFYSIQVFVYPSRELFNKIFYGVIEKRFYSRRKSLEDLYIVRDSDGNIHILSPRGKGKQDIESLKKILVMKILEEYMEENQKQSVEKILMTVIQQKNKQENLNKEKTEEEEKKEESEEIEDNEEEIEELIETELTLEQIDDKLNENDKNNKSDDEAREWLNIGWISYVNGKLKKEKNIKDFSNNISKKGVKKLGQLRRTRLFETYNFSEEYACALVEYVVSIYGVKKFTEFYEKPKDIKKIFGITKYRFNEEVKAFMYRRYSDKKMLINMEQKGLDEVTKVHFEKDGGVYILSDKEIKSPEINIKE